MHILALCCLLNLKENNIAIEFDFVFSIVWPQQKYPIEQIKENLAGKRSSG